MLQLHKETLFIPCQRSAIKEVNHYSLCLFMNVNISKKIVASVYVCDSKYVLSIQVLLR